MPLRSRVLFGQTVPPLISEYWAHEHLILAVSVPFGVSCLWNCFLAVSLHFHQWRSCFHDLISLYLELIYEALTPAPSRSRVLDSQCSKPLMVVVAANCDVTSTVLQEVTWRGNKQLEPMKSAQWSISWSQEKMEKETGDSYNQCIWQAAHQENFLKCSQTF